MSAATFARGIFSYARQLIPASALSSGAAGTYTVCGDYSTADRGAGKNSTNESETKRAAAELLLFLGAPYGPATRLVAARPKAADRFPGGGRE